MCSSFSLRRFSEAKPIHLPSAAVYSDSVANVAAWNLTSDYEVRLIHQVSLLFDVIYLPSVKERIRGPAYSAQPYLIYPFQPRRPLHGREIRFGCARETARNTILPA